MGTWEHGTILEGNKDSHGRPSVLSSMKRMLAELLNSKVSICLIWPAPISVLSKVKVQLLQINDKHNGQKTGGSDETPPLIDQQPIASKRH